MRRKNNKNNSNTDCTMEESDSDSDSDDYEIFEHQRPMVHNTPSSVEDDETESLDGHQEILLPPESDGDAHDIDVQELDSVHEDDEQEMPLEPETLDPAHVEDDIPPNMVLVYFCGDNQEEKTLLLKDFKKATKRKPDLIPEVHSRRVRRNGGQDKTVQYWENIIKQHHEQVQQCIGNDTKVYVVIYGIIDILADAIVSLDGDCFQNLLDRSRKVGQLVQQCQSSLLFLLPNQQDIRSSRASTNQDGIHRNNRPKATGSRQDDRTEKYHKIIAMYSIPYLKLGYIETGKPEHFKDGTSLNDTNTNESRIELIKYAVKKYVFPLDTLRFRKKEKKKPIKHGPTEDSDHVTTNFLFNKPMRKNDERIAIRTIDITEDTYTNDWVIIQGGRTNRFMTKYPYSKEKIVQLYFNVSVRSEIVKQMLMGTVTVNGMNYAFLGCSSEGLKHRKCFMWQGTQQEVTSIIQHNGDFDQNVVSKRMARFGLLFSEVMMTSMEIQNDQIVLEDDIVSDCKRYNFTDGCGSIGLEIAQSVTAEINRIDNTDIITPPSVFKIRLQGYKGVLTLCKEIKGHNIKIRPSMIKFETSAHPRLGICEYSKPFTFGHLNQQYIALLSALGVPDEIFTDFQTAQFERLRGMTVNLEATICILQWQKKSDLARVVIDLGKMNLLPSEEMKELRKLQAQLSISKKSKNIRIVVPKSRYIFGVCDPYGILEYGECYVRVTATTSGHVKNVSGPVVVCKSPCYLLGDIRVLKAVSDMDKPELSKLSHLVDCIVFPIRGARPHPNETAGSDLDGDMFFVCWDENLIPPVTRQPYDYPAAQSKPEGCVTVEKVISYFSQQNEAQIMTNKVAKYIRAWSDKEGMMSDKCAQLGMMFSRVIDAAKTGAAIGIPKALQPPEDNSSKRKFIWQTMEENAEKFREAFRHGFVSDFMSHLDSPENLDESFNLKHNLPDLPDDLVQEILDENQSKIKEFDKFRFAWIQAENVNDSDEDICDIFVSKYGQYIDFSQFSLEEKRYASNLGVPIDIIQNSMRRSKLLKKDDLEWFNMHSSRTPWKFYYEKENSELNWQHLVKAITSYDSSCVMLGLPDKIVIVLQFLYKLQQGMEQYISPGSISAVFFSKNFGYKYRYTVGEDYYMDLTDDTLQIYRNRERNQTFVFLRASDLRKIGGKLYCEENRNALSVDLSRFYRNIYSNERPHPLLNKTLLTRVEVFVRNDDPDNPAYYDVIDASGDFPYEEQTDVEDLDDEEQYFDIDALLDQSNTSIQDHVTTEEILVHLKLAADRCNMYDFEHLLSKMNFDDQETNNTIVDLFVLLLVNFIHKTTGRNVPMKIKESLYFSVSINQIAKDTMKRLYIAELLCRLNLHSVAGQFLYIDENEVTVQRFFDILNHWQLFWYVGMDIALQFINGLTVMTLKHNLTSTLSNDQSLKLKYIVHFSRLHCLELIHSMNKLRKQLEQNPLNSLNPGGVSNLKLDKHQDYNLEGDTEHVEVVTLYRSNALSYIPKIYEGQFVTLVRHRDTPHCTSYALIGQVMKVTQAPFFVEVNIFGRLPDTVQQSLGAERLQLWKIDVISNIITYQRIIQALQIMGKDIEKNVKVPLFSLLTFPGFHPETSPLNNEQICKDAISPASKYANASLYQRDVGSFECSSECIDKQKLAIETALKETVCCITGPPGTGKTTVACCIIEKLVRLEKYKHLLIIAETNIAIDNIARKLRNKEFIVRVGTQDGIARDLYEISLEGQAKRIATLEAKSLTIKDKTGKEQRNTELYLEVLEKATVILATCASVGDSLLAKLRFDFVLVDEASVTKETTLLCSLVHGCIHLVMIGDSMQLSPFVTQSHDHITEESKDLPDVSYLSNTLFHRLNKCNGVPSIILDTQYRMHPELLKFPSREFYGNQLLSHESVNCLPSFVFKWPDWTKPICFIDSTGYEKSIGSSYNNDDEAIVVNNVIETLLRVSDKDVDESFKKYRRTIETLSVKQITILTFYQGQVKCIKDKLKARGVCVNTVDGYQGCENDVIVVSTVRSNKQGILGFSDDRCRLNVLLTRARFGLIVVGNSESLKKSEIWTRWFHAYDAPILSSQEFSMMSVTQPKFTRKYEKPFTKSVSGKKTRQKINFRH
ncbi:unnamed protein product [Mytilus coruscus]|uniref:Uncharacterized protein n=1 Tax=Mytilus coruscus TaxID=42192 RepID=A0A6J8CG92_MYTCO|nr:unnamed protein product [Mytilus coruscus]